MPNVIIMEGPDGCGKTEIGKALSKKLGIPYFKVKTEKQNWRRGKFKEALEFDQTYIAEFIKQVKCDVIIDRAWPSEYVYSAVFGRETNPDVLIHVDEAFGKMGAIIVLCLRRSYEGARIDELVPYRKLTELHDEYLNFFRDWTRCKVVTVFVDDFDDNTNAQMTKLIPALDAVMTGPDTRVEVSR